MTNKHVLNYSGSVPCICQRHGGSVAMLGCGRRSIKGYSHKGRREAGGGGYFSRLKSPIVHGGCARNCRVEASRARLKCFISFSSPTAGFECCFGKSHGIHSLRDVHPISPVPVIPLSLAVAPLAHSRTAVCPKIVCQSAPCAAYIPRTVEPPCN
jgi:hypothetical protein